MFFAQRYLAVASVAVTPTEDFSLALMQDDRFIVHGCRLKAKYKAAMQRIGDMSAAGKVFSKMKAAAPDVEPNEIVYGAAISCCRKANHPERALLLLRKMAELNI